MSLDATSRMANVKDSVKKFFVDNLVRGGNGIQVSFDRELTTPKIQGTEVTRWVAVHFMPLDMSKSLARWDVRIVCCTKKDSEGFRLAQLRDIVMGYLTDNTMGDQMRRVDLYKSKPAPDPWEKIGTMLIKLIPGGETPDDSGTGGDNTKYHIINLQFIWGANS